MRRSHLIPILLVVVGGCDSSSPPPIPPGSMDAIAYIQRGPSGLGNVFDYSEGGDGSNLFTLTPPSPSGVKKNLTNWTGGDINALDVSFDAREIVLSGKAPMDSNYHLYRVNVDGTNPCDAALGKVTQGPCQITSGGNDQVYPIYLPAGRIFYVTNKNVEGPAVPQFRDEYERGTTAQAASCALDGSNEILGPRNVSHRVSPTLMADGRVLLTEWRHLGETNEGDLTILNQDMTGTREGFGREGKGLTNAYLRAQELSPGQILAIGTSRDRTFQAGKIVLINLGGPDVTTQSEARSSAQDLTPDVPGDRTPSFQGVGRYYDVMPIPTSTTKFLVSWSDGPVETEVLAMAKANPQFGIYVYDTQTKTRFPLLNDPGVWDVSPHAVVKRAEPAALKPAFVADGTASTLISAINVYDSTMFPNMTPGVVKKARLTEGFSSEEGFPNMFGLTEFDGQARLGEVDVQPDGSFKAVVPANTPIRVQLIDKYGLAVNTSGPGGSNASEPIWIQGRAGEARVCGGCHEDRTKAIQIAPGSSALQALGAAAFDYQGLTRQQRQTTTYTADKVMGVPWDKALQPIFDAHCVDCHDGTAGAANPSYTIVDVTDMTSFSFTFNLMGTPVQVNEGTDGMYTYTASHVALMGPDMLFREKQIMVTMGDPKEYVSPGNAYASTVIKMLNPPARYPAIDHNDHAFGAAAQHPAEVGTYNGHVGTDAKYQLTDDEQFLMGLMADNGGQFYSRENAPGGGN